MPSPFDNLQKAVFDATLNAFGYQAEWTPSAGGAKQTAQVHFQRPTNSRDQLKVEYNPFIYTMEWLEGDFVGLIESYRQGGEEYVKVDGLDYRVQEILAFWDGKTHRAQLQRMS